ncbi:MAG TPA: hypothetical protein VKT51_08860 [Candidatus Eremiobacteraceae bacterium]|nr:hypothetical protein [Candidatus Eremiobacteraceae bacterium]
MYYDNRPSQRVSREALYELVWAEPLVVIAPRFGISDVGLRKACKRANIPLPTAGYWAKVRNGKRVGRRPRLPKSLANRNSDIVIRSSIRRPAEVEFEIPDDVGSLIALTKSRTVPWEIPQSVRSHPIVAGWKVRDQFTPDAVERRRRRFLSILFREVERLEGSVSAEDKTHFKVTLAGEIIEVLVKEPYRQVKVPLTEDDRRYSWNQNRDWNIKTESSGSLILQIESYVRSTIRRRWHDKPTSPLENQVDSIILGLLAAVAPVRQRRIEWEESERQRAREEQERWAREERQRKEREQLETLLAEVNAWHKAQLIRSYVSARLDAAGGFDSASTSLKNWADRATRAADRLDPARGDSGSRGL